MEVKIVVLPELMLGLRKMRSRASAKAVGITEQNISLLKSGRVKGIRFESLEGTCAALNCRPGEILEPVVTP